MPTNSSFGNAELPDLEMICCRGGRNFAATSAAVGERGQSGNLVLGFACCFHGVLVIVFPMREIRRFYVDRFHRRIRFKWTA